MNNYCYRAYKEFAFLEVAQEGSEIRPEPDSEYQIQRQATDVPPDKNKLVRVVMKQWWQTTPVEKQPENGEED